MLKTYRYIIFLNCLLFVGSVPSMVLGQTIHAILATDRACPKIGHGVAIDLENITHLLRSNIPPASLNLVTLDVDSMTSDGMLGAVDRLNVNPNDTILFYYSGHGANDAKNQKQFFDLTKEKSKLYRETLLTKMEEKLPRLAVLLSDCCNNESDAIGVRSVSLQNSRVLKTPGSFSPLFENLLVFCKGTADLTSSKPGEYSFVDTKNPSRGSFFTWALVELFDHNKTNADLDWLAIPEKLGAGVQTALRESYPEIAKDIAEKGQARGQSGQTVFVYKLPGMSATPTFDPTPTGPRLGLRAIAHDEGGVRITGIAPETPASRAGFVVGEVITEINGKTIRNETDYSDAIDHSPKIMEAKIRRVDNSTKTLTVELGW